MQGSEFALILNVDVRFGEDPCKSNKRKSKISTKGNNDHGDIWNYIYLSGCLYQRFEIFDKNPNEDDIENIVEGDGYS
jgi:hypothetical protein